MITVEIVPNDIEIVAKAIIINSENKVLFLKRSEYTKKFAGEWDLPGGHLREGESLVAGLVREVKEETSLNIEQAVFVKKQKNLHFFKCKFKEQKISLSKEHTEFKFMEISELEGSEEKFKKIALSVLKEND